MKKTVIGILTVPVSKTFKNINIKSYLPSSYVKWLEMNGVQVVPILFNWPKKKILSVLNQINGVVFPGGSVDRVTHKVFYEYINSYNIIFNYAKKEFHNGNQFPLWATCLGFEFLLLMTLNNLDTIYDSYVNEKLISKVEARHQQVSLNILPNMLNNQFFSLFKEKDYSIFFNKCIYMNHGFGFVYDIKKLYWILPHIYVLSTNLDKNNIEYLSSIKFKTYPFYGTQWHPEKPLFEWLDKHIGHTKSSIFISKIMSEKFTNECKKNTNTLKNEELLIYYYDLYSRNDVLSIIDPKHNTKENKSVFEQSYYFN